MPVRSAGPGAGPSALPRRREAKRIGILGGISPESTRLYYDHIIEAYYMREQDYHYPEIVIYSLDFQRFTDLENSRDTGGYIREIMTGITALQNAGAEFAIMAANSPHAVFDPVSRQASIPLLSIVEITAERARREGLRSLLLLGIKFTMHSSFYQEACRKRGLHLTVPALDEQDEIERIIFEELALGIVRAGSRERLLAIISRYNVEGVILGCTELPLILGPEDTTVPLLNTMQLHAEAALDYALGKTAPISLQEGSQP
jgi:aspartate racemase